jgi:hypothetical protein
MAKQEYTVQRKVISWEQVSVEATSFDEAVELAEDSEGWDEVYDQSEATEDYWVKNQDTNQAKMKLEYGGWEEAN